MKFKNRVVDRIWLVLIAVAFAVMTPIWVILSVERMGWRVVAALLFLAFAYRWMCATPRNADPPPAKPRQRA